jgi:hypothetical protein
MSFNGSARQARNPALPLPVRARALRSCVMRLCRLTGERYTHALARYGDALGSDLYSLTEQELASALARITNERNQILEKVRAFERRRVLEKRRGKRRWAKADAAAYQALLYR